MARTQPASWFALLAAHPTTPGWGDFDWQLIIIATIAVLIAIALVTVVWYATRQSPSRAPDDAVAPSSGEQVAVVVNPSKDGADDVVTQIQAACADAALPDPLVYFTTIDSPGTAQARDALEAGADVVIAAGGDGTVRAVAAALVDEEIPMGIVPMGTGNLFARNLDLPVGTPSEAIEVVMAGRDRWVDVGWLRVTDAASLPGLSPLAQAGEDAGAALSASIDPIGVESVGPALVGDKHIFLVIAGIGFDAAMVADADHSMKRRFGWLAYFGAGIKHLHAPRIPADITIDDRNPVATMLRTVMVANCGLLPGGLALLPSAEIDDGLLDVAAIDTRVGLAGWMQLFGEVVMLGATEKPDTFDEPDRPWKIGQIDTAQARRVVVGVATPQLAQVDGDLIGRVREVEIWIDPGSLIVRGI